MSAADLILDVIDGALRDYELSPDAMRWIPEESREDSRLTAWRDGEAADALRYSLSARVEIDRTLTSALVAAEMTELYLRVTEGIFTLPARPVPDPEPVRELTLPHRVEVSVTMPLDERHARAAAEFTRANGSAGQ